MSPRALSTPMLIIALVIGSLGAGCGEAGPRTRVVLISLDTLRSDRFDTERMPVLHAAAQDGLVFERFHAATSVTLPTHVSMFTGLHPWQHGVLRNGVLAPVSLRTAAERLGEGGFHTAAVVASFPLESRFRADQGFDVYMDEFVETRDKRVWNGQPIPDSLFNSPADTIVDTALRLLDEAGDREKQFLFVHCFDPHAPYGDTREDGHRTELAELLDAAKSRAPRLTDLLAGAEALYDEDVRFMDEQLGRLLDRLAAEADTWDTHVIITADHGESFGEDGSLGHGKRLTVGQLHVPCVLLSPRTGPGRRADVAGSVDVLPTLLSMAGLPGDPDLPGRDLLGPAPSDPRALGMRSVFDRSQRDVRMDGRALRVDSLRFYIARGDGLVAGNSDVQDAHSGDLDDSERVGIARLFGGFEDEVAERMRDMVESADPETRKALEALGYLR